MKEILVLLIFITSLSCAQEIPRDTSYTINSGYKKIIKKHPFIKKIDTAVPEEIEVIENIPYKTIGKSRHLLMNVYFPSDTTKNYPGVLLVHGGGWRTGDKSLLIPMAQQLASRGYVTAVVEYRLSLEAPFPAAVKDLKNAIRWLRANSGDFPIDVSKIAVYGTSAGGQLAALVGTTNGNSLLEGEHEEFTSDVQAIIDVDGVLAFKHPESEEGTMAAQWLGGTFEEVPENWKAASALTHVDENTPPVLFIGSSFPRFLAGKNDMIRVLEKNNIYYESYLIPDSPHSFWLFHPWFNPTLEYTAGFLDKVFKIEINEN